MSLSEWTKPDPGENDLAAVRGLYQNMIAAWNRRDAAGMASYFAPGGSVVGFDGSGFEGRAAIEKEMAGIFASHMTASYVTIVREVRLLGPAAALLRAAAGMVPRGGAALNPAVNAIQGLVAAKMEGGWQIELFQNTPAQFHGRPELVQALTEELSRQIGQGGV